MSTVYADQPDLDAVKAYLGATFSGQDDAIQNALSAEIAAQLKVCGLPTSYDAATDTTTISYPADVAEALKRRVARNLAVKNLPLGIAASFADGAVQTNRIYGNDPEIARLERPYRKLAVR